MIPIKNELRHLVTAVSRNGEERDLFEIGKVFN
jgi:hypothetical protein